MVLHMQKLTAQVQSQVTKITDIWGANTVGVKRKLCTYQRAQLKAADECAKDSN